MDAKVSGLASKYEMWRSCRYKIVIGKPCMFYKNVDRKDSPWTKREAFEFDVLGLGKPSCTQRRLVTQTTREQKQEIWPYDMHTWAEFPLSTAMPVFIIRNECSNINQVPRTTPEWGWLTRWTVRTVSLKSLQMLYIRAYTMDVITKESERTVAAEGHMR